MPFVKTDEKTSLYYEEYGEGTPIVFIHAITLSHLNWQVQVRELSHRYRVIVYDLRGHGKSTTDPNVTYAKLAMDMERLLDHLQCKQAYLCGYSNSASIAFEFLKRYPQKTSGVISVGGYQSVSDWYMHLRIYAALFLIHTGLFSFLSPSIAGSNAATHRQYRLFLKDGEKSDPQAVKKMLEEGLRYDATEQLRTATVPFLLVYGKKDKWMHKYATRMQQTVKKAEMRFIDGIGHQIPTIKGDELNQVIHSWIESVEQNQK